MPGQFAVLWDRKKVLSPDLPVWASQYQSGRGWRASSAPCATVLQALATAGVDRGGLAASTCTCYQSNSYLLKFYGGCGRF